MKAIQIKNIILLAVVAIIAVSCSKKLDLYPQNDITPDKAYADAAGYKAGLAKIYSTLAVAGRNGPNGASDLDGLDGGSQTGFIRAFFNCQELPTDEAMCAWNDQTIQDFHNLRWSSADPFIKGMYARPVYNVKIINDYLNEATAEKLATRNITGTAASDILVSAYEARFLRAFNYWVVMDLFGKSSFIPQDLPVSSLPEEIERPALFEYIETELKAIETELPAPKTNEYGRVDKAAAWALLARMYLNAQVYTGTPRYADAALYAKKVIDEGGYSLNPAYPQLFMADNDNADSRKEMIFAIRCHGLNTQGYGNTSFLAHAAAGDDFGDYGVDGGWAGYRATKGLADLFADLSGGTDKRALFTTSKFEPTPEQIIINNIGLFAEGLHVKKYINLRSDGNPVSNLTFADIDFPVFRLAEMYLIYAEAAARSASGTNKADGVSYINLLRERAHGNQGSSITEAQLTPQFVLDERGRELFWEGHRRTDLIRFDLLTTGTYLWPWKGGVAGGTAVDAKYNLFPIPADFRTVNPNLSQNANY